MRGLLVLSAICFVGLGCGGDDSKKVDAAVGDTGGGGSDMMPDMPGGGGGLDCATYCSKVMTACVAPRAQYSTMQNCLDSCSTFPVGAAADQTGHTLGCRINHANLAATDPATHCVHAGPGGGGVCGATDCDGFCSIVVAKCATQWTMQMCTSTQNGCPSFTSAPPYSTTSTGDTLECRLYHATMAASNPAGHCSHTTANSTTCQ